MSVERRGTRVELGPHTHRLDAAHRNVERSLGWVTMADNKALIALTFQGAIIAGIAVTADPLRQVLEKHPTSPVSLVIDALLLVFLVSFCFSILEMFRAISPRTEHTYDMDETAALFFFGTAVAMDADTYGRRMAVLEPDDISDGLAKLAYATAQIANAKFRALRRSYYWLGLQMLSFVVTLLLSIIRPLN